MCQSARIYLHYGREVLLQCPSDLCLLLGGFSEEVSGLVSVHQLSCGGPLCSKRSGSRRRFVVAYGATGISATAIQEELDR